MDRKRLCQNLHFNSSLGSSLQQLRWSGRIALPLISDLGVNTHFLRIHMRGGIFTYWVDKLRQYVRLHDERGMDMWQMVFAGGELLPVSNTARE